jgi:hypothetical protein
MESIVKLNLAGTGQMALGQRVAELAVATATAVGRVIRQMRGVAEQVAERIGVAQPADAVADSNGPQLAAVERPSPAKSPAKKAPATKAPVKKAAAKKAPAKKAPVKKAAAKKAPAKKAPVKKAAAKKAPAKKSSPKQSPAKRSAAKKQKPDPPEGRGRGEPPS